MLEALMENLRRELDQKTAQLAALREIGRAINAAWELDATLALITRKTAEVMGMDSCSIYLLDNADIEDLGTPSTSSASIDRASVDVGDSGPPPSWRQDRAFAGEYLVLKATTGLAQESVGVARLRMGEGLTGWSAYAGKPVGVADAAHDPRFKYLPETKEWAFQSLLSVPLVNQDRVIGAMNVQTRAYHEYDADEVELLSLIGDLAAGALEKAMLYERMQRQITELSTLAEASETLTSPLYLDEMLGLIVEMAAQVQHAKGCSLMLLDEEQGDLILRATHGFGSDYRDKPPLSVGEGIAGRVAQIGEPIAVMDVRRDPRYYYPDVAVREGLCSLLCVPLRVRERVIGVFMCYAGEPHTFTAEETGLFQTLANQTALAIENSRLVVNTAVVREMHHRVKNNLQTIAMLLRLQLREGPQVNAEEALGESINRILSIAAVHQALSERGFRLVDVRQVLDQVARTVTQNRLHTCRGLRVEVTGDEVALPSRSATALTLAVNELIQNALKHAFAGRESGRLAISVHARPPGYEVVVSDDGVGLPAGKPPERSLGLQIVETLVSQDLGGRLSVERGEQGTRATILVPGPAGGGQNS
jgi:signal transduction protein with GAF and PtsI domain/anti-sigma regulatory factor (Ser/Thr protein kinase)